MLSLNFISTAQQTIQTNGVEYTLFEQQWYTSKSVSDETYLLKDNHWQYLSPQYNTLYQIVGNEIAIEYKEGTSTNDIILLENASGISKTYTSPYGIHFYVINTGVDIFTAYQTVKNSSLIKNATITKYGKWAGLPNDTDFNSQWYLHQPNNMLASIQIDSAWDITTGDSSVVIAVIDAEIDWTHDDIGMGNDNYQSIYLNPGEDAWSDPLDPTTGNGIDDDGNGLIDDWKGWDFGHNLALTPGDNDTRISSPTYRHGTPVAGIIAAKRNNNLGIAGIAGGNNNSGVKVLPIKVMGLGGNPSTLSTATAVDYAVSMGVSIIQMSVDLPIVDAFILNPSIENAYNNGVLIIGAAGTLSPGDTIQEPIIYPASHPYVFSVSATDSLGQVSQYSNYGPRVNIAAPGEAIYSTGAADGYDYYIGSSFAAPIVAGIAGLMKSVNPCLSADIIQTILETTTDKIGGYDYDWRCSTKGHSRQLGYGKVNVYQAVKKASELQLPSGADLYMKDGHRDLGIEPNSGTLGTLTPDIVIRNDNDSIFETFGTLVYDELSKDSTLYLYVKVRNRGCSASLGTEQLKVYWSMIGATLTWPDDYNGVNTYPNTNEPVGGMINSVTLPVIPAGKFAVIEIPWQMPDISNYPALTSDGGHFVSILGRIEATNDPMTIAEDAYTYLNSRANNNIVLTNATIYFIGQKNRQLNSNPNEVELIGNPILIGNPTESVETYDFRFETTSTTPLSDVAEVEVTLSDAIWQAWQNSGMQQNGIELVSSSEQIIKLLSPTATLKNISLPPNEIDLITINPYFLTDVVHQYQEYDMNIVQIESTQQQEVGRFTSYFVIENRPVFNADAGNDEMMYEDETVHLSAINIGEDAIYNWYDQEGNLIYEGQEFYVSPEVTTEYELEVIALADGFKDYDEVMVNVLPYKIKSLNPNPATNQFTIEYDAQDANSVYLLITSPYTNHVYNYILNAQDENYTINISAFPAGLYSVVLICDGQLADQKALIIQ